jgi:hypothetical protein
VAETIAAAVRLGIVAGVALAAATAARNEAAAQDVPPKLAFVRDVQQALRANDKAWLAGAMRYPVRYFGRRTMLIRNRSWFVAHYSSIFDAELRAAVLAQDPNNVFENWQGMMVGEGSRNIWIQQSGDGAAARYRIVTINNAK